MSTGQNGTHRDMRFMSAALRLARSHLGQTLTNPSVGCLIVKDDVIVGRGVTAISGRPHAETVALKDAGESARGGTAYVTLEPCSHHGKTPPCADALIAAGIARVVIGLVDPDDRVSGEGINRLSAAGLIVETGLLEDEGRRLLAGYLTRKMKARPQVILKLAISANGAMGRATEGNVAITGALARRMTHMLRAESDAILIGIGTARADDPELTCRLPGLEHRSPRALVLDPRLELSVESRLVRACQGIHARPLTIVTAMNADPSKQAALKAAGAEIWPIGTDNLERLLEKLAHDGVSTLIVEGGAKIASAFLTAGCVDSILRFTSPKHISGEIIRAPLAPDDLPAGFRLVRQDWFDGDRLDELERN